MNQKGFLVTVEGIDGSGKTVLSSALAAALGADGIEIVSTREPGDTHIGAKLRKILHEEEEKNKACDLMEFLLFAADRAQHFEKVVVPSLKANKVVISDRMADSSVAYQGYGRGLDVEKIKTVNNWAMQNIKPDLTFYLKIDADTAHQRIFKRNKVLTSFEKEKMDFWEKVISGYENVFKNRRDVVIIDGKLSPAQVCDEAIRSFTERYL